MKKRWYVTKLGYFCISHGEKSGILCTWRVMGGEEEQGDKGKKKRERRGKRVKHNCKHTEWEDKTIRMRA